MPNECSFLNKYTVNDWHIRCSLSSPQVSNNSQPPKVFLFNILFLFETSFLYLKQTTFNCQQDTFLKILFLPNIKCTKQTNYSGQCLRLLHHPPCVVNEPSNTQKPQTRIIIRNNCLILRSNSHPACTLWVTKEQTRRTDYIHQKCVNLWRATEATTVTYHARHHLRNPNFLPPMNYCCSHLKYNFWSDYSLSFCPFFFPISQRCPSATSQASWQRNAKELDGTCARWLLAIAKLTQLNCSDLKQVTPSCTDENSPNWRCRVTNTHKGASNA